ncbi:MAG: hypothetical protein AAF573_23235, partial [Bacteroidota bacterium]
AWQHIFWDAPFRTVLWDEAWMNAILPLFSSMTYEDFITNLDIDDAIQSSIRATGWFYFLCALVAIFIKKIPKVLTYLLWLGSLSLMVLAFLYCKEKFFQWGQFWEYSLQFSSPLFLFFLWKNQNVIDRLILWMKITIAITFVSHGLYALNYYPRPGHFTQMTISILNVSEANAVTFLNIAGILDFLLAIGLFLNKKIVKLSLAYAIFWGFATTMARIVAHVSFDMMEEGLMMWAYQSVYRIPHFLIPLAVYLKLRMEPASKLRGMIDYSETLEK